MYGKNEQTWFLLLRLLLLKICKETKELKGKTANLWRYRALAGGFYIFKHEYVMVFQKV